MEFRLSVEELSFALTLLDEKIVARELLKAHFGELGEAEVVQRFIGVSHSLIARGFLTFSVPDGTLRPSSALVTLLRALAHPLYTLRVSRVDEDTETVRTYHFHKEGVIAQILEETGLVYTLKSFGAEEGAREVEREGSQLFHLEPTAEVIEGEIEQQTFSQLTAPSRRDGLINRLKEEGISSSLAMMLDEDFRQERFRGSISRIDYQENQTVSDYAILIFGARKGTWIGRVLPLESKILFRTATVETLREELTLLMEKRYRR